MKTKVHFIAEELIDPANPISVNVIGAGGTGSKVLTALMEMNYSLIELGHPGLMVRLWDDDVITNANIGRQRFAECEVGLNKSVALINRINRWSGTHWKAEEKQFSFERNGKLPDHAKSIIYISCVDNVEARFQIAEMIKMANDSNYSNHKPLYWMDFGNSRYTGQVILSTVGEIDQPNSDKYEPVATLPLVTDEFGDLLRASQAEDNTPSCSLAEALRKQDLFINSSLAQMGCSLLWNLLTTGFIEYRGFFHNLKDFSTHGIML